MMSGSATETSKERIGGVLLRAGIILLGFGVLWGWLWFSAVHAIPYFFVIAPIVEVAAYAVTGICVNRELCRYQVTSAQHIGLAVLAISLFYLGNRVLWLTLLAGFSSFTENYNVWAHLVYEAAVIGAGVIMAVERLSPRIGRARRLA